MTGVPTATLPRRPLACCLAVCCWIVLSWPGATLAQPATGGAPAPLNAAELEELVGPVALYPDDLLAIVLPASVYPLQIVQASRLLAQVEEGGEVVPDPDWDDSVVALLNYPEVVALLNEDLDWTWRLGEAVIAQEAEVLAAVAAFRDRAHDAGNLRSDAHQRVERNGPVIEVAPTHREVIYVPYYAPQEVVVYQPLTVYHYHPRARPLYYYPYASGFRGGGTFWGVSSFFRLGWATRHLHIYHHQHIHHPYYGRHYREDRYRSHHYRRYIAHGYRDESDHPRWQADRKHRISRHQWRGSSPGAVRYPGATSPTRPDAGASRKRPLPSRQRAAARSDIDRRGEEHPAPRAYRQTLPQPAPTTSAAATLSGSGAKIARMRKELAAERRPGARRLMSRQEQKPPSQGVRRGDGGRATAVPARRQAAENRTRDAHARAISARIERNFHPRALAVQPPRGAVTGTAEARQRRGATGSRDMVSARDKRSFRGATPDTPRAVVISPNSRPAVPEKTSRGTFRAAFGPGDRRAPREAHGSGNRSAHSRDR